jgi:fatty-acyl-CoA synthase
VDHGRQRRHQRLFAPVDPKLIFDAIREHGVTHYCGAPIVHSLMANAPAELRAGITQKVAGLIAAAPPPAAVIEAMANIGVDSRTSTA